MKMETVIYENIDDKYIQLLFSRAWHEMSTVLHGSVCGYLLGKLKYECCQEPCKKVLPNHHIKIQIHKKWLIRGRVRMAWRIICQQRLAKPSSIYWVKNHWIIMAPNCTRYYGHPVMQRGDITFISRWYSLNNFLNELPSTYDLMSECQISYMKLIQ